MLIKTWIFSYLHCLKGFTEIFHNHLCLRFNVGKILETYVYTMLYIYTFINETR